jgi:hypothetical protein
MSPSFESHQAHGAATKRFVRFEYCVSIGVATMRRQSKTYSLRPGERALWKSLPYSLLTALLGWWGVPWGFIQTPIVLVRNFSGGDASPAPDPGPPGPSS